MLTCLAVARFDILHVRVCIKVCLEINLYTIHTHTRIQACLHFSQVYELPLFMLATGLSDFFFPLSAKAKHGIA